MSLTNLLFVVLLVTVANATSVSYPELGPVRMCRCYANSGSTHMSSTMRALGLGPAEICHCFPSIDHSSSSSMIPTEADLITPPSSVSYSHIGIPHGPRGPRGPASPPPSPAPALEEVCDIGMSMKATYTVDDTTNVYMCGKQISYGSLYDVSTFDLHAYKYACGKFLFEVNNAWLASGISFTVTVDGYKYIAVGRGSPPLPPNTYPLKAYATWTRRPSCVGIPLPKEAVYVSYLNYSNAAFKTLAEQGAYPIGAEDGFVRKNGLQCIYIETHFCNKEPTGLLQI